MLYYKMSYSLKPMPAGLPSPVHPIIIQGRLNPRKTYLNPLPSDYVAPPFSLVFSNVAKEPSKITTGESALLKRKRDNDVMDVFTNAYDIQSRSKVGSEIRCIGAVYEGSMDFKNIKENPDARGRIGIIISGSVSILCDPNDLKDMCIGDEISWEFRDNGNVYEGCPDTWSTVKLKKYHNPLGYMETEEIYKDVFGPETPYTGSEKDQKELKLRLKYIYTKIPAGIPEYYGIDGVSHKKLVGTIATILLKHLDIDISSGWEDVLYSPKSDYFIMETLPTGDENDIKWIYDCFGDLSGPMYIIINPSGKVELNPTTKKNRIFLPQSRGWFSEFISVTSKNYIYKKYKTGKPFISFVEPDISTKMFNGIEFTNPLLDTVKLTGERTLSRFRWIKYAKDGYITTNQAPRNNTMDDETFKLYRALSKTQYDFSQISKNDASKIVNILNNQKMPQPKNFKKWLADKRQSIISLRHKQQNKIGMLLSKSESHATILMNTQ